jgi:hypothetical protein
MDMKQCGVIVGLIIALAILGAAVWYFGSPLFLDQAVDEPLPFTLPEATPVRETTRVGMIYTLAQVERTNRDNEVAQQPTAESTRAEVTAEVPAKIIEDVAVEVVEEATEESTESAIGSVTPDAPVVVGLGEFQDGDSFHQGSGNATLFQGPDGAYLLRFDDFAVANGPDLHVLLSTNPAPTDHESLESYLDLGSLKGNMGSQNYALPTGIDGAQFKSVVIYCLPFHVIFATATLN